jgi:guanine deaminase
VQVDDAFEYGGFDDSIILAQLRHPTQNRSLSAQQILRAEAVEV